MVTEPFIISQSGQAVSLLDPQPWQIILPDIVTALHRIPRFTGHAEFSVLQHSMLVADLFAINNRGEQRGALHALIHDAHEAYIGDISNPCAKAIDQVQIRKIKFRLQNAIEEALETPGTRTKYTVEIADADYVALQIERHMLLPASPFWVADHCWSDKEMSRFTYWRDVLSPVALTTMFTTRFYLLKDMANAEALRTGGVGSGEVDEMPRIGEVPGNGWAG